MKIVAAITLGISFLAASPAYSDPSVTRALNDFNQAIVQVNEVEAECYAARATLKPGIFGNMELEPDHIRTALAYFYYRNIAECTESAVSHFALKAAILSSLSSDMADGVAAGVALITQPHVSALRRETEYLLLPAEIREHLEKIEELDTPFHLMGASELVAPLNNQKD